MRGFFFPIGAPGFTTHRFKKTNVILSEPSEFVAPAFGATNNSDASRTDLHFCLIGHQTLSRKSTHTGTARRHGGENHGL